MSIEIHAPSLQFESNEIPESHFTITPKRSPLKMLTIQDLCISMAGVQVGDEIAGSLKIFRKTRLETVGARITSKRFTIEARVKASAECGTI